MEITFSLFYLFGGLYMNYVPICIGVASGVNVLHACVVAVICL